MKYAVNHPWKFRSWSAAFVIGLLEVSVMILVQATNMFVLLSNNTVVNVVTNFLAILIISRFDDFMFVVNRRQAVGELITNG